MVGAPSDPLAFIQRCVRERKLLWTYHVNMRLEKRHITRVEILDAVESYEIIESYPDDKYLPTIDEAGDNIRIVTAYRPDENEWESDLRTRKKRR